MVYRETNDRKLSEREQRIYSFLHQNPAGVLATVDADGEPHGTVVYYTIDKNFTIAFLTKTGTRKYDNLIRHNNAMLVVYDSVSQTVAQVVGKAVEIRDSYDVNAVAAAVFMTSLKTSEGGVPPIAKLQAGEYTAFRIEPQQVRMAIYARPGPGDYDTLFESIESFNLKESHT